MKRLRSGRPAPARRQLGVLILLVAFATMASTVTAAPAQPNFDPPFPRIGMYGVVLGTGYPYLDSEGVLVQQEVLNTARYQVAVLHASPLTEYRPDIVTAIRDARPDIQLYAYLQAHYIWPSNQPDSNVNLWTRQHHLVRDLDGFLYDRDGQWILDVNINLAKKDAQGHFVVAESLAHFFHSAVLQSGLWDGLFFDRYCFNLQWNQGPSDSIDFVRAGYPTWAAFDAGWKAGSDTLASRLRQLAPNTILIGNCGYGAHYGHLNGWMREDFPNMNGTSWTTNMNRIPGGYFYDEENYQTPRSNWISSWVANAASPYSSEESRRVRFGLGSASLADGYASFTARHYDSSLAYMDWWYDEYAVDVMPGVSSAAQQHTGWLGRDLGPYYKMLWVGTSPDAVTNPGFDTDVTTGWTFSSVIGGSVVRDPTTKVVGSASAWIRNPNGGGTGATWFKTTGSIQFAAGGYYAVTFWAKAYVPRVMQVAIVDGQPGAGRAWQDVTIDQTWRRYQLPFTGAGIGPASLCFRTGQEFGDIWLDDVHFQAGVQSCYRRDFQNGIVLVNPTTSGLNVALEHPYRKLRGFVDPFTNNGLTVTNVPLPPSDAVFLLRPTSELVDVPTVPAPPGAPGLVWGAAGPNPFQDQVRVMLTLAGTTPGGAVETEVTVFDVAGRRVRRIFEGPLENGGHVFDWNGTDESGRRVSPGVYFLRASRGPESITRKLFRIE